MPTKRAKNKPAARSKARAKHEPPAAALATGRDLLAQALEAPDDDLPRQIYADWLEEQAHPFAQVIRLQLAGETKKANALIGRHRKQWIEPIGEWLDDPPFERGMLSRLSGTSGKYTQKATQALLLEAVRVFGVRKTWLRGACKKLETAETLAWTSELFWRDSQLDDPTLAAFAASPHIARLSSLTLEKVRCSNEGLWALSKSPNLPRLRHFALVAPVNLGDNYGSGGIRPILERLSVTSLSLTGANTTDVENIVGRPAVARLQRLSVATKHVRAIASSPHLTSLESLRISSINHVDDDDVAPFLDNPALAKLTSLTLHLWSDFARKPERAMLDRLQARFGSGLVYKTDGLPGIL